MSRGKCPGEISSGVTSHRQPRYFTMFAGPKNYSYATGNFRSQRQCPLSGVSVWWTELVDGRSSVIHLRRSNASWLNARSLLDTIGLHVGHCDEKVVCIGQTKFSCHGNDPWAIATEFHTNHPLPVVLSILKISRRSDALFWNNWARTSNKNRKQFRQLVIQGHG